MPIYENIVIGNFLFGLGLKLGGKGSNPGISVHLTQQTPLDIVLGDVLLTGPRSVALLEFKRAAAKPKKEKAKLGALRRVLALPEHISLEDTSRLVHFYVETSDDLHDDGSRVLPYLDLLTKSTGRRLGQLIDDLASNARSAPKLDTIQIKACQRYLELVSSCQGHSHHPSPGLLVGLDGSGKIGFASLADVGDLLSTFTAIREHELALFRQQDLATTREIKSAREFRLTQERSYSRSHGLERNM